LIILGGAPVNPEILQFFQDIGFLCVQGYGLTECAPILALNRDVAFKNHAAGLPLPGCDVKILDRLYAPRCQLKLSLPHGRLIGRHNPPRPPAVGCKGPYWMPAP
ncbi:MAG: AMP-binding protein, partial [Spirochaetia bacterium]|nr:AMP-binding protein [Spirochaetia bacterium]